MKIEKYIESLNKNWFYYHYWDNKTDKPILHGLYNEYYDVGIGYHYHDIVKGFWLMDKRCL